MSVFTSLIGGTSFAQFADFASPAFFKVMSMRKLLGRGRGLVAAYRDEPSWRDAARARSDALTRAAIAVDLVTTATSAAPLVAQSADARAHGETILALYFHQLASPTPTLLDLASARFHTRDARLLWAPGRGHVTWDPLFQSAITNVYASYYGGGGEAELRVALEPLGLADASDLFIKQFGGGDQRAVTFEVSAFIASFHAIFVRCKERGVELHADFLPLGLYLAALYSTLEALGGSFDVRAAFSRAT